MATRDDRHFGYLAVPPRSRPYGPLSGAAKYPAGARPSKYIIIIPIRAANFSDHRLRGWAPKWQVVSRFALLNLSNRIVAFSIIFPLPA
jgi:hypothetical protein